MPLPNEEFGRAVRDAIEWLGCTPESAGPTLGIKTQTLNAMCSGIVPMRSLVIRFASEIAQRCDASSDAPANWWRDVDAWLATAGYPPRRDLVAAPEEGGTGEPGAGGRPPRRIHLAPLPRPAEDPCADEPANHHYRPVYERLKLGEEYVHIFWLIDRSEQKTHMFRYPAPVDYRRRAQALKGDLTTMTKAHFERRYARYRVEQ